MSVKAMSRVLAAAVLGCGAVVSAQTPTQQPTDRMADQKAMSSTVKVAGCVQAETAVLKRDTVTGQTGMGDEFVITQAKLNRSTGAMEKPQTETPPSEATGTSGSMGPGKVYRVTGDKESDLKNYVGQRVEIVGSFKNDEDAKRETATGTSGTTPTGELTAANTPEITIDSVRAISGSCSPMK